MRKRRNSYMSSGTLVAAIEHKLTSQVLHDNLRTHLHKALWDLHSFQNELELLVKEGHDYDPNM